MDVFRESTSLGARGGWASEGYRFAVEGNPLDQRVAAERVATRTDRARGSSHHWSSGRAARRVRPQPVHPRAVHLRARDIRDDCASCRATVRSRHVSDVCLRLNRGVEGHGVERERRQPIHVRLRSAGPTHRGPPATAGIGATIPSNGTSDPPCQWLERYMLDTV